jgi:hypothetical protein
MSVEVPALPPPLGLSGGGSERTVAEVHAAICGLVQSNAANHAVWAEYAETFPSLPPPKKRKRNRNVSAHDTAEDITLCVACVDGSSLRLTVPPRELVREVKRAIGQVRRLV